MFAYSLRLHEFVELAQKTAADQLFLLDCFDDPFLGDVMVGPTAFKTIGSNFNAIEDPGAPFLNSKQA